MSTDALPIPTHLASEFYAWVWWSSEQRGGHFDLGENLGPVDLWVDDRIAFRNPDAQKVAAVLTGENPSTTLEARAALEAYVHECRQRMRDRGLREHERQRCSSELGSGCVTERTESGNRQRREREAFRERECPTA